MNEEVKEEKVEETQEKKVEETQEETTEEKKEPKPFWKKALTIGGIILAAAAAGAVGLAIAGSRYGEGLPVLEDKSEPGAKPED